jgi:PAS domain S-box-containing protein
MLKWLIKLTEEIDKLGDPSKFGAAKAALQENLARIRTDFEKLNFKYERSIKEKKVLSSLLTRTSVDLTKVSETLRNRAEELTTLLKTIPAYVYFKDTNLNYIIVNESFVHLAGIPYEKIIGKKAQDVLMGYEPMTYSGCEADVIRNGETYYNIEEVLDVPSGKRWVSSNIAPIRDAAGSIIGLIGISWDITERKDYEEELRLAKEMAEAGTLAKNEFIASVSHEFRTPMNGILGLAEILRNTGLTVEQSELLSGISTSAENLLVVLNDVLDFAAIEAGRMELEFYPFMLDRVLNDIEMMTKMKAGEKSLDFGIRIDPMVPIAITGDSKRLRQILLNLVSNALKFTEKGRIDIIATVVTITPTNVVLKFEVADTGVGIPEQWLGSLFKVFSRVRQDQTKTVAGTGLGLSICKKLTDMLGGTIGVRSKPGEGSVFWFTLPFSLSRPVNEKIREQAQVAIELFNGKSVLVAEDNVINQRIVVYQLKRMGFEIEMASNGLEAWNKYREREFDLIILDIQMPEMDGYDVAREIRNLEADTGAHSLIIALTANAMKGDRERYLAAGMDGYISKPFTFETLFKTISQVWSGRR